MVRPDDNAPLKHVSSTEFMDLWRKLKPEERYGRLEQAEAGYESLWNDEKKEWWLIRD
jgi:hypothetical protein